ncbi:MAG TPA: tRNA 2-selenouridine(34) synthase MnmH [Cyclobacteriaceae bacterium]|nr:tRNA 2-selenouridine(34) synthase MnmH [Cyclobacteriaceae bacterium]
MPIPIADFLNLRNQLPIIDVRSEGEYGEGHMRGAVNIPLLNDEGRIVVGTTYKNNGQQEAIREGFRQVGPRLPEIIEATEKIADRKEVLVHCWRGGMRSSNFCQFLGMARIKSHSLEGGYKSYRQFAQQVYHVPYKIILLGGCTGSGKSEILQALADQGEQILDLEKLANHRGSAFGGLLMPPQPTTEQFQNDLFEELLKLDISRQVWVEDESLAIGKVYIPKEFWTPMHDGPLVQMDVSKDIRVQRLVDEYGAADRDEFLSIMGKVTKKLGGQHYQQAKEKLLQGDLFATIEILLTYYDKAYLGSIDRRRNQLKLTLSWDGKHPEEYAKQLIELQKFEV